MTVLGIDHVQLAIPPGGEERARAFYGATLGLVEVEKPAAMRGRGGMWFQAGPVQIHLGLEPEMRPSVKAHPALVVAGLDAYLARLAAAGYAWTEATDLPGIRRGHTTDPFGNRIELIERGGPVVA
ncbi:MAG: VOC family protein [Deltaproteobacteria bacterium]|nr:VOC family protein [Deltaproteobacteria bacterium]